MLLQQTKVLTVSPDLSNPRDIDSLKFAAEIIKRGGLVAFPTETVYGLGANALDENAVKSIFTAKGRPQDNPLIVHVSTPDDISLYANTQNNKAFDILKDEMPAPLTVILPKKENISDTVSANLDSVGMRVPVSKVARKLISLAGVPIAAPSANLSGKPSPTCARHVIDDMTGRVDVIIDAGNSLVGVESTVLSLCTDIPEILRPGGFTLEMLQRLLGKVNVSDAVLEKLKEGQTAASPGMKYRHYAPNVPLTLVKGTRENVKKYLYDALRNKDCAVMCCDGLIENTDNVKGIILSLGDSERLEGYASLLFDTLRRLDEMPQIKEAFAALPEDTQGISLAIYNRMLRASGFNVADADVACAITEVLS